MGAKTALLAFTGGDLRPALLSALPSAVTDAETLVRKVHPGQTVTLVGDGTLADWVYPPDGLTYATILPQAELLCDRRLVLDRPSELPEHILTAGAGRRIIMHGMHSVIDWICFAVWDDRTLIRSLSLSPGGGILENIGQPYDFEIPFWAGRHAVEPVSSWPDQDPYPFPFHPLDLGEEALRALFGFVIEGHPETIDPDDIHMHGFRVADPSDEDQVHREHLLEQALRAMRPPRRFQMRPDGTMDEISFDQIGSTEGTRSVPPTLM